MPNEVVVFNAKEAGAKLTQLVTDRRPQLAALFGVELESERGKAMIDRFVTVALHAATSDQKILRATPESIVESIRDAAMLGLEPVGVTGDGAIVVYDERVKRERPGQTGGVVVYEERVPTAHFQPMYRGLLKLARRSEKVAHIDAHVVYAGDTFELQLGSEPYVRHVPLLVGDRGDYLGAYAVAETDRGRRYVDWMSSADIEVVRRKSRAKDDMAWTDFWPEMARKTVLRRLMKRLPLETLAEMGLRLEAEAEDRAVPVSAPAEVESMSDAKRRLRARLGADGAPAGQEPAAADAAAGQQTGSDDTRMNTTGEQAAPAPSGSGSAPAEPVTEFLDAVAWCASQSDPALGAIEPCSLPAGHDGVHKSAAGSTWPA